MGTARSAAYAISRPGISSCSTSESVVISHPTRLREKERCLVRFKPSTCSRPFSFFASCHSFVSFYLTIVVLGVEPEARILRPMRR